MRGQIVTFYSYKGGTGRSMSLANAAWILASNGLRVLAVDWDLEAPGLHRYFHPFLSDPTLGSSPGVINLIWEFAAAALDPSAPEEPGWHREYARTAPYATSVDHRFPDKGTIDLLSAGRQDNTYSAMVNSFDWDNFYHQLGGGGFLEALMEDMRAHYDYVLVDSRTGLSDTAGICTVQLPDTLVACFSMSAQAIEGTAAVAASVARQRMDTPVTIFPVPMRVEDGEKAMREASLDSARAHFERFLGHVPDHDRYWGDVEVPYRAYYAYEEVLATIADRPNQPSSVLAATERLVSYLTHGGVTEGVQTASDAELLELLTHFRRTAAAGHRTVRSPVRRQTENLDADAHPTATPERTGAARYPVLHRAEVYRRAPGRDAEQRVELGRAYLAGGMPRMAEELLEPLVTGRSATAEVRYYYALAVLDGRSPSDLDAAQSTALNDALRIDDLPDNGWRQGIAVIGTLRKRGVAHSDPARPISATLGLLSPPRRTEIVRHLNGLLDEELVVGSDPDVSDTLAWARNRDVRDDRIEQFFQPPPALPRLEEPQLTGRSRPETWLSATLGILVCALSLAGVVTSGIGDTALPLLLLAMGAVMTWASRSLTIATRTRFELETDSLRPVANTADEDSFRQHIVDLVEREFQAALTQLNLPDLMPVISHAKANLVEHLVRTYSSPDAVQPPGASLDWLVRRETESMISHMLAGTYRPVTPTTSKRVVASILLAGGLTAVGVGFLLLTRGMPVSLYLACGSALIAGAAGAVTAAGIAGARLAFLAELAQLKRAYSRAQINYDRQVHKWTEMPTDAEIGRLLDFDKLAARRTATRRAGLDPHEVIKHVTITQPATGARRARFLNGPPRYSSYSIATLLFSRGGVRMIEVDLDLATGQFTAERRTSFRYDAVTSVMIQRTAPSPRAEPGNEPIGSSLALRLTLADGMKRTFRVEDYDSFFDPDVEDLDHLTRLAMETAGITSAIPVLEKVAAMGRDWVADETGRSTIRESPSGRRD